MEQTTGAHALEYAGFWPRLGAFLIDALLLSMILRILFPFQGFYSNLWHFEPAWYLVPLMAISNVVSTVSTVAYSVAFWTWRGQTPGKIAMNIKILRADGTNINFGYSLLRYLGYIVCGLMLGAGFLWIAFDSRKQGIHDKIADTVVVKLPEPIRTQTTLASPKPSTS
jgi:uncharacterized RDD family membrane protein YckC